MYTSPRRKGAPSESRSSLRADSSTLNPTPLAINPAMPDGLANASRPHSKLRTRAPSESRSSLRADSSTLNPTPLAINPAMPDGLANASRPHSKLRTREALFVRISGAFGRPAGF